MNDTVLIVGAGPTGLSAAAGAASAGRKVVLVEKEKVLGGAPILSGYARLVPSGEWAKDAVGRMVARVTGGARVTIHKGAKVAGIEGDLGNFAATLSNGQTVNAGAIILATGFTHFDSINKPEWGFGTYEDVVTTTQVEQMVASGKITCPSDGRVPERVCILLCVGSRDRQIGPDVYIYYMDIRTFGLYEDKYYWRSQEEFRTKFVKARIAEVTQDPTSGCWSRAKTRWSSARS